MEKAEILKIRLGRIAKLIEIEAPQIIIDGELALCGKLYGLTGPQFENQLQATIKAQQVYEQSIQWAQ